MYKKTIESTLLISVLWKLPHSVYQSMKASAASFQHLSFNFKIPFIEK